MHRFDVTLKLLFRRPGGALMRALAGGAVVAEWLEVELPEYRSRRVDILCRLKDGRLLHIELQSRNDRYMAVRMAEYALAVYRRYGEFPRQIVLYVGKAPMRMRTALRGPRMAFGYEAIDARELDGDTLLESADVGDNVIAVLARLQNREAAVGRIVRRIAEATEAERETAVRQLLLLAGLRGLETNVEEEIRKVPILYDIMDNKVLGREYRKGVEAGIQTGIQTGKSELLRSLALTRFGHLPAGFDERVSGKTPEELELLGRRLLVAASVDELLN